MNIVLVVSNLFFNFLICKKLEAALGPGKLQILSSANAKFLLQKKRLFFKDRDMK